MQLTLHATRRTPNGASRLMLAMSAWSVKTRRAPSRHCEYAKVYGHATTAMHDNEYLPPPRLCTLHIASPGALVSPKVLSFYYRYMASGDALTDIMGGVEVTSASTPCVRALSG